MSGVMECWKQKLTQLIADAVQVTLFEPPQVRSYAVAEKVGFAHLSPEAFELLVVVVLNRDAFLIRGFGTVASKDLWRDFLRVRMTYSRLEKDIQRNS